jgi:hypothetical protein
VMKEVKWEKGKNLMSLSLTHSCCSPKCGTYGSFSCIPTYQSWCVKKKTHQSCMHFKFVYVKCELIDFQFLIKFLLYVCLSLIHYFIIIYTSFWAVPLWCNIMYV